MTNKILIPTPLRPYAQGRDAIEVNASTVSEALASLVSQHPALRQHLFGDDGRLRSFVNVYLNDDDVRYLDSGSTAIRPGDVLTIVPSIAGGRQASATNSGELSREEIRRYNRHLIMPEVTIEGQKKLKAASVLMVGAGGLGSPLGLYLAAAGIGRLGIVDFDVVDVSNLQRQILHGTSDVGRPKLESAARRLKDLNPYTCIETYETALTSENALDILRDYDIIVDGTDNFPTRYLVNDACVLLAKPNVYGSIFRFEGQASVFHAAAGPCYRCLYPEPPPPGLVPSCAEGGVLGILPGIIGVIQATETVKLVLGIGQSLIGRLLLFDALQMSFRELRLKKNPDCPICGARPTITGLVDYDQFCGIAPRTAGTSDAAGEWDLTPVELKRRLDRGEPLTLIDVREPHEYQITRIEGARLIPLGQVAERMHEIPQNDDVVVYCKAGMRSAQAVSVLRQAGLTRVQNLRGGIDAWADQVEPSMPRY